MSVIPRLLSKKAPRLVIATVLAFIVGLQILRRNGNNEPLDHNPLWSGHFDVLDSETNSSRIDLPAEPPHSEPQPEDGTMLTATNENTATEAITTGSRLACSVTKGLQDVVYVIKTGATEALEKLPVHFNTTLKCFPHYLIFSDYAEILDGHVIHDALEDIIDDIRLSDTDFELWRRLRDGGRAILRPEELSLQDVDPNSGGGQPDNSGWRLDKFKNIPMTAKALGLKSEAKWFIFTDADTYVSWSNVLRFTKQLDHNEPLYIGSAAQLGDQVFAHGGSGYLLSRPAMSRVAELYEQNQEEWDRYAASSAFGDYVLGFALESKLDIRVTWAFPQIQGGDPSNRDFSEFAYDRQLWCYPAISYHHLKPATIESLSEFEQKFVETSAEEPMRHRHVFKDWAMPQMRDVKSAWNNGASSEVGIPDGDVEACQVYCQTHDCFQYTITNGVCRVSQDYPMLGNKPSPATTSGWRLDAIDAWVAGLDEKCVGSQGEWILS